jgi:hypothetical protein
VSDTSILILVERTYCSGVHGALYLLFHGPEAVYLFFQVDEREDVGQVSLTSSSPYRVAGHQVVLNQMCG